MERRGLGAHGAVYRAVGPETGVGPVALKLALHPKDERFAREVELLKRIRHPSVPRLVDHGDWRRPEGFAYPYLVMELVDGVSLYHWARERAPTSRQVLRVLARLARALEATHGAGGVHRDVKGDNVLVSDVGDRVFLTDFGSGHFVGASTLTWHPFPPGTPEYRSPEAWRSMRLLVRGSNAPYAPGPADDVFALGVTAYRLVTDEYPPPSDTVPHFEHEERAAPPSARAVNGRCCEELSDLTARMLSRNPEARGSARELAEVLERAARETGPEADVPLFIRVTSGVDEATVELARPAEHSRRSWLMTASVGWALALAVGWMLGASPDSDEQEAHASMTEDTKDGGTVAVGDSALTAPVSPRQAPASWSTIGVDLPPRPLRGQIRPDAMGRCPHRSHVAINGGCWKKLAVTQKDCEEQDYVYKGACYVPVFRPERPPTSSPTEQFKDSP
ncbi:serine/threonine protein kinase [Pyxidicoccus fallax]|nr:serine/threonine-protein kinase [Pyxidicoccus fallax]